MGLLTPIKRLLNGRPLYKRVASSSSIQRQSESTTSDRDVDDDNDVYSEHDELVHGTFVYCAFLMLGESH